MLEGLRVKILGTSGFSPWKSRFAKKWTSCRIFWNDASLQVDIGNKYEGKPVDYLLITHLHYDHVQEFASLPEDVRVLVPSNSFIEPLREKNPKADIQLFKDKIDLHGLKIKPFPVLHSKNTLTYGFRFNYSRKVFVWLPDFCVIPMFPEVMSRIDTLFLGAAAMKDDIQHKGYGNCQKAIYGILERLSELKRPPKRIVLIHFGMGMHPIPTKTKYLIRKFPSLNIEFSWDNKNIRIA